MSNTPETNINPQRGSFMQLLPFIAFVGLYISGLIISPEHASPIFACIVGIAIALFTFPQGTSFSFRMGKIIEGSSKKTIIAMIYIFIFAAIFAYCLEKIGGIQAAVDTGLAVIPQKFVLPGFFALVCLFSVSIGSSMGTIAALLPIGAVLGNTLGMDPAFMAGLVVGGAMLGDNLSIISDTTIAATQMTGCNMKDKFWANIKFVLPAFVLTTGVLTVINFNHDFSNIGPLADSIQSENLLKLVPYALVLVLAISGLNVIAVLVLSILVTIAIGIYGGYFGFVEGSQLLLNGFTENSDMHEVLILSLLIAGLGHMTEYTGGLQYILRKIEHRVNTRGGAEFMIASLVLLINSAVAINTVAIIISSPVAKKIAEGYQISKQRLACLLDIFSCICQGLIPYGPQLLLAASISKVRSIDIIPHLHYQGIILVIMLATMIYDSKKREAN